MAMESTWLATPPVGALPRPLLARAVRLAGWDLPDLSAPFWRCYLPLERGGTVTWEGREWPLEPGRWLLVAPRTAASTRCERPFRKAYLHLRWTPPGRVARPGVWGDRLPRPAVRALTAMVEDAAAGRGAAMEALGLSLQAWAAHALAAIAEEALVAEPQPSVVVAEAMALLRDDPARTPDNATLGRLLGLHPGSVVRRFSSELGVSPQRFALDWRLDVAAERLVEGDEAIEAIAEACGFGDRHHFTRAFTARWGSPPATFRSRARG